MSSPRSVPGAGSGDRRARLREQMKEFYGDPTTSATKRDMSPQKVGVAREMDLDSEYFNVSRYTTDLLRQESLKGLVEADTELLRRVRHLDSELQELVYRNYAKFISATDTIREMHNNISEMDTKLQALTSNVSNIDQVSHQITGTLHEHRNKIEETVKVNRLMKKAQFLVGLPAMMRQLMERKDYGTCVKYWVAGDGFLEKHHAIPSIQKVHHDCRLLSKDLYAKIEEVMCSFPLDDPEAMDNIRKFVEDLRLLRATSLAAEMKSEDGTFEDTVLRALMRSVSANFAKGIAAVQRDTKTALAPPDFAAIEYAKRDEPLASANLREALAQLKGVCALLSVNSERVYALLNREGAGVAMRVAQEVQPMLVDLLAPVAELTGSLAVAACAAAAEEAGAHMLSKDRHDTVPHVLSSVAGALARQLKNLSVTLKTLGANYLDTAHSQQSRTYGALVDRAVCDILLQCVRLLREKAQQAPSAQALAAVAEPLRRDTMLVVQSPEAKARHERLAFSLSRYAYGSLAASLADGLQTVLVDSDALAAADAKDVGQALHDAAKLLQHRAVVLAGQVGVTAVEDLFQNNDLPHNVVAERLRDLVADCGRRRRGDRGPGAAAAAQHRAPHQVERREPCRPARRRLVQQPRLWRRRRQQRRPQQRPPRARRPAAGALRPPRARLAAEQRGAAFREPEPAIPHDAAGRPTRDDDRLHRAVRAEGAGGDGARRVCLRRARLQPRAGTQHIPAARGAGPAQGQPRPRVAQGVGRERRDGGAEAAGRGLHLRLRALPGEGAAVPHRAGGHPRGEPRRRRRGRRGRRRRARHRGLQPAAGASGTTGGERRRPGAEGGCAAGAPGRHRDAADRRCAGAAVPHRREGTATAGDG
ncbi:hypothetical protein STCU_04019 [Strigomonas culicis]|uniref:Vacuolar protein sorting-associated protein 51 homolog n=1 Tax=Strigomonas culicis TaxID=28005 RepID=S9UNP0_9TRYP|nr:hypothetical protein STCU_04019 [Strigomonas culicis]|eukprot:EPY30533.1 hypothetical protein STCU_04019 [Strigomonas culicis]